MVDEEETFYDSTVAAVMDYYLTNGAWVYDGGNFPGGGGHSVGNGSGIMRVMATKGGLKGGGNNDAAYAWDTIWAGAFPFEPRYSRLRRLTNPLDNTIKDTTGKSYDGSGEGEAYPILLFVSSAYGDSLFVASASMGSYDRLQSLIDHGHRPLAPKDTLLPAPFSVMPIRRACRPERGKDATWQWFRSGSLVPGTARPGCRHYHFTRRMHKQRHVGH